MTSRIQRVAFDTSKDLKGLQDSYSNVAMKKGGNTYMRPFVRTGTMY